ncbi:lysine 2,3-aminomutase [Paramagnetospirillum caucaseum]|uniref:Lysine 2,3-aminomutase n=1 Tax=Paramagnetospirillum caucaseum TaxID=1244869 RepID=M3ACA1_9PROT|nr:lysine 2,3-aminomutase [Paramagnetospirillum caucaseum]
MWLAVHVNHPRELSPLAAAGLERLARAGVPLLSQTVLLKGVNDRAEVLEELFRALVRNRVRPYYLHHPDLAPGTAHFRPSVAEGQALMRRLRGRLSGIAQPTYVLDIPGGAGKVPVGPGYWDGEGGRLPIRRAGRTAIRRNDGYSCLPVGDLIGSAPNFRQPCWNSHEDQCQPDSSRQHSRTQRPPVRRAEDPDRPARQGRRLHHRRDARHPHRQQDQRALAHRRHRREVQRRGQGVHLPVPRRFDHDLHGFRELRAVHHAQRHPGRHHRLPAGRHGGRGGLRRRFAGFHHPAGKGGDEGGRGRPGGEGADRVVVLQAGQAGKRHEDPGSPLPGRGRGDLGQHHRMHLCRAVQGLSGDHSLRTAQRHDGGGPQGRP